LTSKYSDETPLIIQTDTVHIFYKHFQDMWHSHNVGSHTWQMTYIQF